MKKFYFFLLKHGKNKTDLCHGLFSEEAGDSIDW